MRKILLLILTLLLSTSVYAAAPTRTYNYVPNSIIDPNENNTNENSLYSYLQVGVDTYAASSITGAAVSASASIPYISLSLSNSIVNADVSATAAIAYSKLNVASSITRTDIASGFGLVPTGGIIMWSGTIATIPTGWLLCDGSNGTPDLRNRFVVAANADSGGVAKSTITGSAAQSGGSTTIAQANLPSYNLSMNTNKSNGNPGTQNASVQAATAADSTVTISSGGSGTVYTQPFYALVFLMKS